MISKSLKTLLIRCVPQVNEVFASYNFHKRSQQPGENITMYIRPVARGGGGGGGGGVLRGLTEHPFGIKKKIINSNISLLHYPIPKSTPPRVGQSGSFQVQF